MTKPKLTVVDGGLMRMHRREQRVLDRAGRLGLPVQKMDAPEGSRSQYSMINPDDGCEMWFGLGELEKFVKWEEGRS